MRREADAPPPWRRLWTSAAAAGLAEVVTMPIDFARVRLQLQSGAATEWASRHTGMVDCIKSTVRAGGPAALFTGMGPALVRQCGYTGLSFLLYEPIRNGISPGTAMVLQHTGVTLRALRCCCCLRTRGAPALATLRVSDDSAKLQDARRATRNVFWPGALQVAWAFLCSTPWRSSRRSCRRATTCQRLTSSNKSYGLAGSWASGQVRAMPSALLFKPCCIDERGSALVDATFTCHLNLARKPGIGPNITRTFLVCAAELGTYDEAKTQLVSRRLLNDGPVAHLCASSAAGLASACISTPVDVVKTRLMCARHATGPEVFLRPQKERVRAHRDPRSAPASTCRRAAALCLRTPG